MYLFSSHFKAFLNSSKEVIANNPLTKEVLELLLKDNYSIKAVDEVLKKHKINKDASLDFLIAYANYILEDKVITDNEFKDFSFLKRTFQIKEGDFYSLKKTEITNVLEKEFLRIYSDNFVDTKEQLLKVDLQALFDLSYDQFEKIMQKEVIRALQEGTKPEDLNIAFLPKGFKI